MCQKFASPSFGPKSGFFWASRCWRQGARVLYKALVIVPILGWVGVGALLHQTRGWPAPKPDDGVVVVVPPRPAKAVEAQAGLPRASDRSGLVRELHKELKRVGCYDGDLNATWSSASRHAMRRFTQSVNAKLPIEEPDVVGLKLVQSHAQGVCSSCPTDQRETHAACAQSAATTEAARPSLVPARADAETTQKSTPLIVGSAATAAAAASVLSRPEPQPTSAVKPVSASPALDDDSRSPRSLRETAPLPPAGLTQPRRRHLARRADSRPPVVVQSLVRNVQRALGSLGIR
jgi:hypothetical protein